MPTLFLDATAEPTSAVVLVSNVERNTTLFQSGSDGVTEDPVRLRDRGEVGKLP